MEKKKTLVIGASENIERYSNKAVRMLKDYNMPVVAYGRRKGEIEGTPIVTDFPEDTDFDSVTLYLSSKNQEEYIDQIIGLKPKRVIFNPGTENEEFEALLAKEGIKAEIACTLVLLRTDQY